VGTVRGQAAAAGEGANDLLRNWERLMRAVCAHTGWQYHVDYRGDGSVAKITAWLPSAHHAGIAQAEVDVYVDGKYHLRRLSVPQFSDEAETVLFANALMGELKRLLPPEAGARVDEVWKRALGKSRAARSRTGKGGRPRYADDEWAYEQVNNEGRDPAEVYREWLERIGKRAERLADPHDSFKKAIRPRGRW